MFFGTFFCYYFGAYLFIINLYRPNVIKFASLENSSLILFFYKSHKFILLYKDFSSQQLSFLVTIYFLFYHFIYLHY